ncbi:Rod shape-determining protein MreD [Candidatus Profftia lariciata]|uniref:rod shape-determining protein MreD n=1 Tax=Candidatus Profftia lariciata TaxID=1987921 RepID=UPI001D03548C|nr:rod shape-determining protein MreD [Candidatus Profftia lariciata]UDG81291.1 Rod shape-determining protein MreD [Candidatus Profftia lariciata]
MLVYDRNHRWMIWLFFLLSFILQIMPWPDTLIILRPNWLALFLIYWVMILPYHINIGTGFILGLIWDIILGSALGIRALAYSLLAYLVALKFYLFRNMPLWQHALMIFLLTAAMNVLISWEVVIITHTDFHPELFWNSLVNGMLWPWFFLLMRKISNRLIK